MSAGEMKPGAPGKRVFIPSSGLGHLTKKVRIWSDEHSAYWRPNGNGYTPSAARAWLLPIEEAERRTAHCGPEKQIEIERATDITAAEMAARDAERARILALIDEELSADRVGDAKERLLRRVGEGG